MSQPTAILQNATFSDLPPWLMFTDPEEIITAKRIGDVLPALAAVQRAVDSGRYAVGFLAYEAAPAFDPALVVCSAGALPPLWFGIYRGMQTATMPTAADAFTISPWTPSISYEDYQAAIARVHAYIADGETYQVNFTMRLHADFAGDPLSCFASLCRAQRGDYGAYLDLGDHVICSASPELFFRRQGRTITCRPMKGTVARGLTTAEDEAKSAWLQASLKNRAENVMIVDMIRNDLGRIAVPGSVQVPELFSIERYETLFQMTSTVTAETGAPLSEVLTALFPCASITGAPKVRTSEIIAELEGTPRGIYTGAIGVVRPGGDAQFNVAIRTMHIDRRSGRIEYGTGGGITWDSTATDEYDECLVKARVLTHGQPDFQLLETMLWTPGEGYFLLDEHLARLSDSARYFGIPLDVARVQAELALHGEAFTDRRRVRLLVSEDGCITVEDTPFPESPSRTWRVAVASSPIDPADRFLYHKTTHRQVYAQAKAGFPDVDDVLLWNPNDELTESTIANVVVRFGARLLTPPVSCGLLPGTFRSHLLKNGEIAEAIIPMSQLGQADAVYLINALRGWIPAELVPGAGRTTR